MSFIKSQLLRQLERQFEETFNHLEGAFKQVGNQISHLNDEYPKLNIHADDEYFTIEAAVPGMTKEELSVEMEEIPSINDRKKFKIIICGATKASNEATKREIWVKQVKKSSFKKEFVLPTGIKDQPETKLEHGILTLRWKCKVTKVTEPVAPQNIKVEIK